jgi:predicted membrane channel-forming protein YqfA (hemolysin III family)
MNPYYDNFRARPPKGWLYGVLLTIVIAWGSGVFWKAFKAHEMSPVSSVGAVFLVLGAVLLAQQAFTNDDYNKSRGTVLVRRVLLPLGGILFLIGKHL